MTREEAVQILNETFINTDGHIKPSNPGKRTALDIHQALTMAIEALSQPSLPSDLDETAEKYADKVEFDTNYNDEWINREDVFNAFKAGAKWQKKQMMSETVEGEVCGRVYDHINVRFRDGVCKFLEPKNISHIPANVSKYKVGDKVKIIIVKEGEQ